MEIIRHIEISFNDSSGVGSSLGLYNSKKMFRNETVTGSEIMELDKFKIWQWDKKLKRHAKKSRNFISVCKNQEWYYIGVCLTFRDWDAWLQCKENDGIRGYFKRLVQYCHDNELGLIAYIRCVEYQSRGVPHIHALLVFDNPGAKIPLPDLDQGWIYGYSRVQRLKRYQLSKNYLANYLAKETQKSYEMYMMHRNKVKGTHMFEMYVSKKYRQVFFDAIVSGYAGWHKRLCYLAGDILKRRFEKGSGSFVEVLGLKIKRLFRWLFVDNLVVAWDGGFQVDGKQIDEEAFWQGMDFVFT